MHKVLTHKTAFEAVSAKVAQEENPGNYLLMHAMGPNVAGVIGTAVAAGVLLMLLTMN